MSGRAILKDGAASSGPKRHSAIRDERCSAFVKIKSKILDLIVQNVPALTHREKIIVSEGSGIIFKKVMKSKDFYLYNFSMDLHSNFIRLA